MNLWNMEESMVIDLDQKEEYMENQLVNIKENALKVERFRL